MDKLNELLQKIYEQLDIDSEFLDLGCGQGRDALFMLQKGFKVTAVDSSQESIKIIKEFIRANNFPLSHINLFCQDIKTFNIVKDKYAIINVFNSLQFLSKQHGIRLPLLFITGLVHILQQYGRRGLSITYVPSVFNLYLLCFPSGIRPEPLLRS